MKKIDHNFMVALQGGSCTASNTALAVNLVACLFFAPACLGLVVTGPVAIICDTTGWISF